MIVIKAVLVIAVLLWAALGLAGLIGARMRHVTGLSPSAQALTGRSLHSGAKTGITLKRECPWARSVGRLR